MSLRLKLFVSTRRLQELRLQTRKLLWGLSLGKDVGFRDDKNDIFLWFSVICICQIPHSNIVSTPLIINIIWVLACWREGISVLNHGFLWEVNKYLKCCLREGTKVYGYIQCIKNHMGPHRPLDFYCKHS